MPNQIVFSAPGSIILLGEHAILHGKSCLSLAISKRIKLSLLPKIDSNLIKINSNNDSYSISLNELNVFEIKNFPENFKYVLTAIKYANIKYGFEIYISSEFQEKIGLGSSGAITVVTVAALKQLQNNNLYLNNESALKEIFNESFKVIQSLQNSKVSGYDIVTSLYGGIIKYSSIPFKMEKFNINNLPLTVFYSGYKTQTSDVLKKINPLEKKHSSIYKKIYELIDEIVENGVSCLLKKNWYDLGELMNINQGLLDAIGVNDINLSEIIYSLRSNGVYGAKISGAGLGDSVVALGKKFHLDEFLSIDLNISSNGLKYE